MTRLVLCRHAEAGNVAQAVGLADALADCPLAAVYTSPLARAVETAQVVSARHRLRAIEVDGLREIDFGDVDGLSFAEYPDGLQAELLRSPTSVRFPGGESYGELKARVSGSLTEITARHQGDTVAVIAHAGPIRSALAAWLQMPDEAIFRLDQRYAALNIVDWIDGVPVVRLVNGLAFPAALGAVL